jgi:hypothetical protein
MIDCPNCGTVHYGDSCLWCESRREELMERLKPDEAVLTLAEVASMALHGEPKTLRQCWRVG